MSLNQDLQDVFEQAPPEFTRFHKHLPLGWIEQALAATGTATLRRRRLPAEQVIWLVIGMALYRDRSIEEVAASLDIAWAGTRGVTVAPSAIPQARERVGSEPVQELFHRTAAHWAHAEARRHAWRGLALYSMDGTSFRVSDTPQNREAFGGHSNGLPSSHPLVRMVGLLATKARLLADVCIGPWSEGEQSLAAQLWSSVPENALVVVDRAFNNTGMLVPLASSGNRHWLIRAKSTSSWKELKAFAEDDWLVEMRVSARARKEDPSLPPTFEARVIGYQRPGHRKQFLITSMLDPVAFPADEVIDTYRTRWEIETGYDEVKTEMLEREETLRSRKPDGVRQELYGLLLAYNLVRLEMCRIADEAEVPPNRISFATALSFIRNEWIWCANSLPGAIPRHLSRLRENVKRFVLPLRRERSFPREVKSRGLKYPRKNVRRP